MTRSIKKAQHAMHRSLIAAILIFGIGGLSHTASAACGGGANGTATLPSTLLTNEVQDGQASGSITAACIRDIIATFSAFRVVTASGAVAVTTADHAVEVNKTVGAATVVNIPACNSNASYQLIIIDGKGDAGTNNLTLTPSAGLINRASTFVMNFNGQTETIYYDGSQCVVSP